MTGPPAAGEAPDAAGASELPGDFPIALGRAVADERAGRCEQALSGFAQAHRLRPQDHEVATRLGRAHHRCGDVGEALELLEATHASRPGDDLSARSLAALLVDMRLDERAALVLHEVLEIRPDDPDALLGLSAIHDRAARYTECREYSEAYLRAVEALPFGVVTAEMPDAYEEASRRRDVCALREQVVGE